MIAKRTQCRLCNSSDLVAEVIFPHTLIADKYSPEAKASSHRYPLDLYRCSSCGHIQVLDIVDLSVLFDSDYTYKPSRNQGLIQHFNKYSAYALDLLGYKTSQCLDIGSNDGLFLSCIKEQSAATVLGIDPAYAAVSYAQSNGIPTLHDFFNAEKSLVIGDKYGLFDIVSANNVFAHNDNLSSFAQGVSNLLRENGLFCFEVSYLYDIIHKTLIGTQFHEHLSHHSLSSLIPFLLRFNLHLFDVQRVDTQGGAVICYARKLSSSSPSPSLSRNLTDLLLLEDELDITGPRAMQLFRSNIIAYKNKFHQLFNDVKQNNCRFVGYGAARSLNLFTSFLQIENHLDLIFEDNPEKQDKYLFDTACRIMPYDPSLITESTVIIPFAWVHTDSIVEKLRSSSVNCKVLTLYPSVQLITL
ncbi:methyltransferase domain-containing protein [Synechococcus sp. A15-24]|uniref:methyltransferase domain-containing protein n=1 Tax=Synechococcus sp. A15-24 TaxID=1050635 RepID=UPI001648998E|nr:methyltransferase domain-containing protein [Synechococcus sp. A15-24]QNJ27823.1 S-adenosyl-L-methionine-dependent methyltransferase [Synechococcus sp. A15-24]